MGSRQVPDVDDSDNESFRGKYEDGHWEWDENRQGLVFLSDLPPISDEPLVEALKIPTGTVDFKDDIDLLEQHRFRKRYQRKTAYEEIAVVTLQDIKDLAIFTAPPYLLSPSLIKLLHTSTAERFIRALIFYCQYYLQTATQMQERVLQLESKIRTPYCTILENVYKDNLCDLRLLVAKEYCIMLIGGADTTKFHHMGANKKMRSLSFKDMRLFESLLRICVQIVWIALGRRSFNQLELEVNRIFKSEGFNSVEHRLKTGIITKMSKEERKVLLGECVRNIAKINIQSPLVNEVFCERQKDYRLMSLGIMKHKNLSLRLQYMQAAVVCPEEELELVGVPVGILGLPQAAFDTMLHVLPATETKKPKSALVASTIRKGSLRSVKSVKSTKSSESSATAVEPIMYADIALPPKGITDTKYAMEWSDERIEPRPCNEHQCRLWLKRLSRLRNINRKSNLSYY